MAGDDNETKRLRDAAPNGPRASNVQSFNNGRGRSSRRGGDGLGNPMFPPPAPSFGARGERAGSGNWNPATSRTSSCQATQQRTGGSADHSVSQQQRTVEGADDSTTQQSPGASAGDGQVRPILTRPNAQTELHRFLPPVGVDWLDQSKIPEGAGFDVGSWLCPHCFQPQTKHEALTCPNPCMSCGERHPSEVCKKRWCSWNWYRSHVPWALREGMVDMFRPSANDLPALQKQLPRVFDNVEPMEAITGQKCKAAEADLDNRTRYEQDKKARLDQVTKTEVYLRKAKAMTKEANEAKRKIAKMEEEASKAEKEAFEVAKQLQEALKKITRLEKDNFAYRTMRRQREAEANCTEWDVKEEADEESRDTAERQQAGFETWMDQEIQRRQAVFAAAARASSEEVHGIPTVKRES